MANSLQKLLLKFAFFQILVFSSFFASSQTIPDFGTAIITNGCEIGTYKYTDQTTVGGVAVTPGSTFYTWDFGNLNGITRTLGASSLIFNPEATYGAPGLYTVTLTIDFGDVSTQFTTTKQIIIYQASDPDFTVDSNVGCAPFNASFSDATGVSSNLVGVATGWTWNFGDGFTSNLQNPNHVYTNPGTYQVTLSVETEAGGVTSCTGTTIKSNFITVQHSPSSSFNVANLPSCGLPFNAIFSNTSTISALPAPPGNIVSYEWTFFDSDVVTVLGTSTLQNPSFSYNAYGTYPVQVKAVSADGCADSMIINNAIVLTENIANFSFPGGIICANANIPFSDVSTAVATSWLWDFGDGGSSTLQDPTHAFATGGIYNVELQTTFADGCTETVTHPVTINSLPDATFSLTPVDGWCQTPRAFIFTPNVTPVGASYAWNFGDPSIIGGGVFGNQPASHTYNQFGDFTVTLDVTDVDGCVANSNFVVPLEDPIASFNLLNLPSGCAPQTINFQSNSTAIEAITNYDWYFDGVNLDADHSDIVSHVYNTPGFYDIRLEITTVNGCTDDTTIINAIEVGAPPIVDAILFDRDGCRVDGSGNGVTFTPDFNALSPSIDSVFWDFGDGITQPIGTAPFFFEHIFEQIGDMTVTLNAVNNGCVTSFVIAAPIHINGPVSRFTINNSGVACSGSPTITFSNMTSVDAVDGTTLYTWDFGDGTVEIHPKASGITHTYLTPGDYVVTVTADNDAVPICSDVSSQVVKITVSTPNFNILQASPVCHETPIIFQDLSTTTSNGNIILWSWDFGDGTIINNNTGADVNHVFAPSTTPYDVVLTITEQDGCSYMSVTQQVTTHGPIADFIMPVAECEATVVNLTDMSLGVPGTTNITSWTWNFGDLASGVNNSSILQNPTHTFSAPGVFIVSLTVTDDNNIPLSCAATITKTITVLQKPVADFTTTRTKFCTGDPGPIPFTDASTNANTYAWDFGDATGTSIVASPLYQFSADGLYDVELTVTAISGCTDVVVKQIQTITPSVTIRVNGIDAATHDYTCPPVVANFTAIPSPNSGFTSWNWEFGDGNTATTQDPTNTYIFPGDYTVRLVAVSDAGCTMDNSLVNFITVQGPKGTFIYDKDKLCYPDIVNFDANGLSGVAKLQWDFGDGQTSGAPHVLTVGEISIVESGGDIAQTIPPHTYIQSGVFYPALVLEDNASCLVRYPTQQLPILSSGDPTADFTWLGGGEICENINFGFTDLSIKDPTTTLAVLLPDVNQWDWTFYDGANITDPILGTSTVQNPNTMYPTPGTYAIKLIATTEFGCTSEIVKTVDIVTPNITASISVLNSVVCAGEVVNFDGSASVSNSGSGTNLPLIFNWTFFDKDGFTVLGSSNLENPSFTYATDGTYDVELLVTDVLLCAGNAIAVNSVTVNKLPEILTHPAPVAVCEGTNVTYTVTPTASSFGIGAIDFQWQVNDGGGWVDLPNTAPYTGSQRLAAVSGSSTLQINPADFSLNGFSYRCVLKQTNTVVCDIISNAALLTVFEAPTASNAGLAQILCDANVVTMAGNTPSIGGGLWTTISGPGGELIQNPTVPNTDINIGFGIYTFQWEITNGSCTSVPSQVIVTNSQSANAGLDQEYCNVSSVTLDGNNAALSGGTGLWTKMSGPAGETITSLAQYNTTVTGLISGTYIFEWETTHAPTCGIPDQMQVIINALPVFTVHPVNITLCENQDATFSVNAGGGVNYQWQVDDGSNPGVFSNITNGGNYSGALTADLLITAATPAFDTYIYRCEITNTTSTCANTSNQAQLRIITSPGNVVTDPTQCLGVAVTITVEGTVLNYIYELRDSGNSLIETITGDGNDMDFSQFVPVGTEIFSVFVTTTALNAATCTVQLPDNAVVTVSGVIPSTSPITGNSPVCVNTTSEIVSVINTPTSTYAWTVPADAALVAGQGTNSIVVDFGLNPVSISVIETSVDGCIGTSINTLVTLNALPTPNFSAIPDLCQDDAIYTFTEGTGPTGGTYSGIGVIAAGTQFDPAVSGFGTYNITYSVTDANSCTGSLIQQITVNSNPNPTIAGANDVCEGTTGITYTTLNNAPSNSYFWTVSGNGTITAGAGTNQITVTWNTAGAGTVSVTETVTATGCAASTANFAVTVNPTFLPPTSVSVDRNNYCADDAGNITLTATGGSGATLEWYDVACGTGSIGNGNPLVIASPVLTTTYFARWENSCGASTCQSIVVTVNPLPDNSLNVDDRNICDGTNTNITLSNSIINYEYLLRLDVGDVAVGAPVNGTGGNITFNVNPTTTTAYNVLATETSTGCSIELLDKSTVLVDNLLNPAIALSDADICNGNNGIITLATSTLGVNYQLRYNVDDSQVVGQLYGGTGASINFTLNPVTTTSYNLLATVTATNCVGQLNDISTVTVYNPPASINAVSNDEICNGGSATITVFATTPGLDYTLRLETTDAVVSTVTSGGGDISFTVSPTTTSVYNILAENTACQQELTDKSTVTVNAIPTAYNVTGGGNFCAGGAGLPVGLDNSDNLVNYQLKKDGFNVGLPIVGNGAAISFGNKTDAGLYTIVSSNANSCNSTMTGNVSIAIDPLPVMPTSLLLDVNNFCSDDAGNITLTAVGGSGTTLAWYTNGCGTTPAGTGTPLVIASPTTTTTYYARWEDSTCGNSTCAQITVAVNPVPVISFNNDASLNTICTGSTIEFTATGGTNYEFLVNGVQVQTGASNTFSTSILTTGQNVSVIVSDANSCSTTSAGVPITVNSLPTVTLAAFADVCDGSGVTILTGGAPAVGTYTGTGVVGGNFNPAIAGLGDHSITYTHTDANGCTDSGTNTITVNALPIVTFNPVPDVCINDAAFAVTGGLPTGGTYTGTGVAGGNFDPATAGTGTHTVTYTFTDGSGCANTAIETITVNPLPAVSFSPIADVCLSASAFALSGGAPLGGTYSGTGVSSGNFDPVTATTGTHTITYTYADANGCSNSTTQTVTVDPLPVVTFAAVADVCINSSAFILSQGSPALGTYSGIGISGGNTFNPSIAGLGTHTITYSYTDGNSCTAAQTQTIVVNDLPVVNQNPIADVCANSASFTLAGGTPLIGTYTGTGVVAGDFDAATAGVGVHNITYSFTNGNGCASFDVVTVTVNPLPILSFAAVSDLCVNDDPYIFTTGTGTHSGAGVIGNKFYPATAGVGTHTLSYSFTDPNGCTAVETQDVTVFDLPTVTFAAVADVCVDGSVFNFTQGVPVGGNYSGTGVVGNTFNPSSAGLGTHTITYSYADGNGCIGTSTQTVTVINKPTVSFAGLAPTYCQFETAVTITGNFAPAGSFTGIGITDNGDGTASFNPTISGTYDISYTYTNGTGCSQTSIKPVTVHPAPVATLVNDAPSNTICLNDDVIFTAVGGVTYEFFIGASSQQNSTLSSFATTNLANGDVVTVITTDMNNCTATATQTMIVNPLPIVTFGALADICLNTPVYALSEGLPAGGTYTGPGVTGGGFTAADATVGLHVLTYTYTDLNGCTNSTNQNITVNPLPVVSFGGLNATYCQSVPDITLTGNPANANGVFTGISITDNNDGTATFNTAVTGTYDITYTYTDGNTCVNSYIQTVSITPAPIASLTNDATGNTICQNDQIIYTATGGTTYEFSVGATVVQANNANSSFTSTVLNNGEMVTVLVTGPSGCSAAASQTITVNALPVVTFGALADVCLNTLITPLSTGLPIGGNYSGPGVLGNSFNAGTAGVGNHVLTYTYTEPINSCTNVANQNIVVNNIPTVTFSGLAPEYCEGDATVLLTGNNAPNGTFTGIGITDNGNGTAAYDPANAGIAIVTYSYTDGNTCSNDEAQSVTVNAAPNATLVNDAVANTICDGETIGFTATGGTNYEFFVNITSVKNSTSNTYSSTTIADSDIISVTVTDVNACTATANNTIAVNPEPVVTFSNDATANTICAGDNVTFTATGGGSYVFKVNGVTDQTGLSGTYINSSLTDNDIVSVLVSNASNCSSSATQTMTVNPLPIVTLTNDAAANTICIGETVLFTASGGTNYDFFLNANPVAVQSGLINTFSSSILAHNDNIMVTVTNGFGCSANSSNVISVNSLPIVTLPAITDVCLNSSTLTLSGATPAGGSYSGIGIVGNTFSPSLPGAGTHTIAYTYNDGNSCTSTATQTVVVNPLPTPAFSNNAAGNEICSGETIVFTAGGGTSYEFYLDNSSVQNGVGTTYNNAAVQNGEDFYVAVTDANGCTAESNPVSITVNALPTVVFSAVADVCEGQAAFVLSQGLPSGGNYTGTGMVGSTFDPAVAGVGTQNITYTYTDANTCVNTANQTVTVNALPVVSLGAFADACASGGNMTLSGGLPAGGTYSGTAISGGVFNPIIAGAGTHSITYTVMNANSCQSSATETILVHPAPTVNISASSTTICEGDNVIFSATSGFTTYAFMLNGVQVATGPSSTYPTTTLNDNDNISVVATDANTCNATSSQIAMNVNSLPVASLSSSATIICAGDNVTFTATPGFINYEFLIGGVTAQVGSANEFTSNAIANTDVVTVVVRSSNICTVTPTGITMTVNPVPVATVSASANPICAGDNTTFTASAGFTNYIFKVNGVEVQNGNVDNFATTALNNLDIVTVDVSNSSNCLTTTSPVIMTVSPTPNVSLSSATTTICAGDDIIFTATSGYTNYDFTVDGASIQNTAANIFTATGLTNSQVVIVTASNGGCSADSPAEIITVNAVPVPTLTESVNPICIGDAVSFTAGGGSQYEFFVAGTSVQGPGAASTYTASNLNNGEIVNVNVLNAANCSAISSDITMVVNGLPSVTMTATDTEICEGASVTFNATAGYTTYDFMLNGVSVQSSAVENYTTTTLINGDVITLATDNASGCSSTTPAIAMTVHANPVSSLSTASTTVCENEPAVFTATSGFTSYDFMINGASVQLGAGDTYTTSGLNDTETVSVTVTNANSCTFTTPDITMTINPLPVATVTASATAICAGDNVTFTATAAFANYDFMLNGVSVQNGTANTYSSSALANADEITVLVSSSASCDATTLPVVMTVSPTPNVSLSSATTTICAGDDIIFTATAGYTNYDFTVDGVTAQNTAANSFTASGLTNNDVIIVTATNLGCSNASSAEIVTVNAVPTATLIESQNPICAGDELTFTAAGGTDYEFYADGSVVQALSAATTFTSSAITNGQTVTVVARNAAGCTDVSPGIVINVNALPIAGMLVNDNEICDGEPVIFTATPAFANYIYTLNGVAVQNSPLNTYTPVGIADNDVVGLVASNVSGCNLTVPAITMTVNPLPVTTLTPSSTAICDGEEVIFTATTSFEVYDFLLNGVSEQQSLDNTYATSNLIDGDVVTVMVTNAGACESTHAGITMTVNALPAASLAATPSNIICEGTSTTLTADAGFDNYRFLVNGDEVQNSLANTFTSTIFADGDVIVTEVTNTDNCMITTVPVAMIVNPVPVVGMTSTDAEICAGEQVYFTATDGYQNYEFTVNGLSIQNATSNLFNSLTLNNGDVVAVIATSNSCSATASSVIMNVHPIPVAATITSNPTPAEICEGQEIIFNASGGDTYEFFIDGLSAQGASTSTSFNTTDVANGQVITANVVSSFGCIATTIGVPVIVNSLPTAVIDASDDFICTGDNVIFTANSGFANYKFFVEGIEVQNGAGNTFASTILSDGDNVTVEVTNASGCVSVSAPSLINVYEQPATTLISDASVICVGNPVTFTATPGFVTYSFTVNGTDVQLSTDNVFTTTTLSDADLVSVTVTNAGGCFASHVGITMSVNPAPVATLDASATIICEGETVNFTTTTGFTNYKFMKNGNEIQNSASSTYNTANLIDGDVITVEAVNTTGCFVAALPVIMTVNPNPVIDFNADDANVCTGETVTFTATNGYDNYDFILNGNSTQSTALNTFVRDDFANGDIVSVNITNTSGCLTSSSPIALTISALPTTGTLSSTATEVCPGDEVIFTATGGASYEFFINGSTVQGPAGATTYSTSVLTNGQTVSVEISNAAGCSASPAPVTVLVNPAAAASLSVSDNGICTDTEVTLTASTGYSNYQFLVNDIIQQESALNTYTTSGLSHNDVITVSVQNANSCNATSSPVIMTMFDRPIVVLITSDDSICESDTVDYVATPGFANYNFMINGIVTQTGTENTYPTSDMTDGDIISVEVGNTSACTTLAAVNAISVTPRPVTPELTVTEQVCVGGAINLLTTATADLYYWTVPDGQVLTTSTPDLTIEPAYVADAGNYTLQVESSTCTSALSLIQTVVVSDAENVNAFAGADVSVCANEDATATLSAGNNVLTGSWATSSSAIIVNPTEPNTVVSNLSAGETYDFIWTIAESVCAASSSDVVTVTTFENPIANTDFFTVGIGETLEEANLSGNDFIPSDDYSINILEEPLGGSVSIYGNGTFDFAPYETVNMIDGFIYEVCLTACPEMCDTAKVNIEINGTILIPDVITVNGDGVNDNFTVRGIEFYPENEVFIFNRWGNEVFHTENYQNDWQGTYDGNELPVGTYFYIFKDLSTGKVVQKGDFTLYR